MCIDVAGCSCSGISEARGGANAKSHPVLLTVAFLHFIVVRLLLVRCAVAAVVAPAASNTVGATDRSTFTTDVALDNGRWLTMEARRIRNKLAVPPPQ